MTKEEVTMGKYYYRRPGWTGKKEVEVLEKRKVLYLRFGSDNFLGKVDGLPDDAIFEERND